MTNATAEIIRLNEEIERMRIEYQASEQSAGIMAKRIQDQDTEIEQLRAALAEITAERDAARITLEASIRVAATTRANAILDEHTPKGT